MNKGSTISTAKFMQHSYRAILTGAKLADLIWGPYHKAYSTHLSTL